MNPFEHANPIVSKAIAEKIVPHINGQQLPDALVAIFVILETLAKSGNIAEAFVTRGMAQVLYNLDKTVNLKNN